LALICIRRINDELVRRFQDAKFGVIKLQRYRTLKEGIIAVRFALQRNPTLDRKARKDLADDVLKNGINGLKGKGSGKGWWSTIIDAAHQSITGESDIVGEAKRQVAKTNDVDFLNSLAAEKNPELEDVIREVIELAHTSLADAIERSLKLTVPAVRMIQNDELTKQLEREIRSGEEKAMTELRVRLVRQMNDASPHDKLDKKYGIIISSYLAISHLL
jgi:hypothetical protein